MSTPQTPSVTTFKIPNLPNAAFLSALRAMGACREAVNWIGDRDAKTALSECRTLDWISWLVDECNGAFGMPTRAEYNKVHEQAWAEYDKVRDQAWAEYNKVHEQAWAEYDKVCDQAWAEYNKVHEQAWAEYNKVRDQAWAEYNKVHEQAWAILLSTVKSMFVFED